MEVAAVKGSEGLPSVMVLKTGHWERLSSYGLALTFGVEATDGGCWYCLLHRLGSVAPPGSDMGFKTVPGK